MPNKIAEQLAELETLARPELRARWDRAFGHLAPKWASRDLLLRALAYHLQEQAEGGLSKAALRRLAGLVDPTIDGGRTRPAAPRPRPGTRLVREWRGEVHRVNVLDGGFDCRGERYASRKCSEEGLDHPGPVTPISGLRVVGGRASGAARTGGPPYDLERDGFRCHR